VVKKFRTIQFLSCFLYQDLKTLLKDYQPDFEKIFIEHINTIISSASEKQLSDSLAKIFSYYFDLYQKAYPPSSQNNIEEIKNFIKDNFYQPLSVNKLCQKFHYTPSYFSTMFKKEAGITYRDYLKKIRIEKAKELMKKTSLTISEVAFEVGYQNFNVFWEAFKSREGISPKEWRRKL
jgi:two-component system response regulator YesN